MRVQRVNASVMTIFSARENRRSPTAGMIAVEQAGRQRGDEMRLKRFDFTNGTTAAAV
jgi:hypothetical protein